MEQWGLTSTVPFRFLPHRNFRRLYLRINGSSCAVEDRIDARFCAVDSHEHRAFHAVDGDRRTLQRDDGVDGIVVNDGVV